MRDPIEPIQILWRQSTENDKDIANASCSSIIFVWLCMNSSTAIRFIYFCSMLCTSTDVNVASDNVTVNLHVCSPRNRTHKHRNMRCTTHLHGQSFENCLLLHRCDIVNGQTNQQIHDDDAHDDEEDGENNVGHCIIIDLASVISASTVNRSVTLWETFRQPTFTQEMILTKTSTVCWMRDHNQIRRSSWRTFSKWTMAAFRKRFGSANQQCYHQKNSARHLNK